MERFSAERLEALRAEGRPVFVNMTAAWCVTCLVNERVALSHPGGAHGLRRAPAWSISRATGRGRTPPSPASCDSHGRDGVPLYVLYPPGHRPGTVLAQILTESTVLSALDAMGR